MFGCCSRGRRGTSIKTRIETFCIILIIRQSESRRGTSIKTRIETLFVIVQLITFEYVAEELPLKQGLKLLI